MSLHSLVSLSLHNFRNNTTARTFEFEQPTTVIVGPNAQGKTSILEAIQLLSTGESFRAETIEEMISFGEELGRVKGVLVSASSAKNDLQNSNHGEKTELEIILTRGIVQGKRTHSRLFSVNTIRRRKKEFVGHFYVVSFRPEDMRLMEGSPARRRTFMDTPLSVLHPEYHTSHSTYEQTLKRRNKLLTSVKEGEMPRSVLTFWNMQLIKHGEVLQKYRQQFLQSFSEVHFPMKFEVEYQPSLISETRLTEYIDREIAAGHTLIGPHKDDLIVYLDKEIVDLERFAIAQYGSRGQQRMAVLWLKICECEYLHRLSGQFPILLLDDILSELDEGARSRVIHLLGKNQAFVTTTDIKMVDEIKQQVADVALVSL